MTENIIEMKDICKGYSMGTERLQVLKNINLTVRRGEFLAILGPSGSGKTTLMNIIGCMDKADNGVYLLNGTDIERQKDDGLAKIRNKEIGFIFQKYHLIPKYNVMQNIVMPLIVRGMSMYEAEKECAQIIDMLGLSERLKHKPTELSGGQQQRVAVCRALATKPSLLLADEPTGALDSVTGKEVLALFKELNSYGNTIVMITHDMGVAANAGRIVHIVDGVLSED